MNRRYRIGMVLLVLIAALLFLAPMVSADQEPNETWRSSEIVGEGTYKGSVGDPGTEDSFDYYMVIVEAGMNLVVKATKTDPESSTIYVKAHGATGLPVGQGEIFITVSAPGYSSTDSLYNNDSYSQTVYIQVSGKGDYTLEIEFTENGGIAGSALACCCFFSVILLTTLVLIILAPFLLVAAIILFFALVVFLIILLILWAIKAGSSKGHPVDQYPYPGEGQPPYGPPPPKGKTKKGKGSKKKKGKKSSKKKRTD